MRGRQSWRFWKVSLEGGIAMLRLDSAPRQNVLHGKALYELDDILQDIREWQSIDKIKGIVIASAKETSFCAGADINEIWALRDASDEKVSELLNRARKIFQGLLDAPVPTVAAISGECLGGGLELTLFCDMRIASNQIKTRFELPETKLGVIPGFGGTQFLPRTVGFRTALEMIVGGKALDAKSALRAGLVDRVVEQGELINEAKKVVLQLASGELRAAHSLPRVERIPVLRSLLRAYMLRATKKMTLAKTKGNYPAFIFACDAVANSTKSIDRGWTKERELFIKSLRTSAARSCMSIFLIQQEARSCQWVSETADAPKKVGVIGAGLMGRGIAYVLALRGIPVIIQDLSAKSIHDSLIFFESLLKKSVKRGKMTQEDASRTMGLITHKVGEHYEEFRDCDLVVEAVIEDVDVKHKVLGKLENVVRPDAVIATNTSSIPLEELTPALRDVTRFLAMHFFNPVHMMDLVEMAGHEHTSPRAMAVALAAVRVMRKTPVVLDKACPGFIVNAVLFPYLSLSLQALLDGEASPDALDGAFKKLGMVMGPMETLDLVGLDTGINVLKVLGRCYQREPYDYSRFIKAVGENKILGQKTGGGFYLYDKRGKRVKVNDVFLAMIRHSKADPAGSADADALAGIIYEQMRISAQKLVSGGFCKQPKFVDLACILGAGVTPNRRGLLGGE